MAKVRNAIENTVSISLLNKGYAGQIFEEVRSAGTKVVIKNNVPECVLMAPDEYISMLDELNEMRAVAAAALRLDGINPKNLLTDEEFSEKTNAPSLIEQLLVGVDLE